MVTIQFYRPTSADTFRRLFKLIASRMLQYVHSSKPETRFNIQCRKWQLTGITYKLSQYKHLEKQCFKCFVLRFHVFEKNGGE